MDRWILKCPGCKTTFTQSVVKPPSKLSELLYVWPPKPEFPNGGVRLECPNCKTASLYQRNQLTYATA